MLDVRNLSLAYGQISALHKVSLHVSEGEIVSIIGANGAGKTSLLNAISGIVTPKDGDIIFEGKRLNGHKPHTVVGRGIVHVPEGRMIFRTLTVEENLQLGAHLQSPVLLSPPNRQDLLDLFPSLAGRLSAPASSLSGGEAQMLALARGLASKPKLLILDEPTLGLSPKAAADLFDLVNRLRDDGLTILLVEQNVRQTLAVCDRGYVLEGGSIVLDGDADFLRSHDLLLSSYLGVATPAT